MPDKMLTEPRNISIDLKENIAQFIKIELLFSNVWISISEISFSSSIAKGNFEKEVVPPTKLIKEISTRRNVWNEVTHSTTWKDELSDYPRLNTKAPEGKKYFIQIHRVLFKSNIC